MSGLTQGLLVYSLCGWERENLHRTDGVPPQKTQTPQREGSELLGGTGSDGTTSRGAGRRGKVSALPSASFCKIPTEESKEDITTFLTFKNQKKTLVYLTE